VARGDQGVAATWRSALTEVTLVLAKPPLSTVPLGSSYFAGAPVRWPWWRIWLLSRASQREALAGAFEIFTVIT